MNRFYLLDYTMFQINVFAFNVLSHTSKENMQIDICVIVVTVVWLSFKIFRKLYNKTLHNIQYINLSFMLRYICLLII